jgi:hypothetical protein
MAKTNYVARFAIETDRGTSLRYLSFEEIDDSTFERKALEKREDIESREFGGSAKVSVRLYRETGSKTN